MFERPLAGWNYLAKALEDRLLAAVVPAPAAPFVLLIALAVRPDTPGPTLFRERRYEFSNGPIEVRKFRTLRVEVERIVRQPHRDLPGAAERPRLRPYRRW